LVEKVVKKSQKKFKMFQKSRRVRAIKVLTVIAQEGGCVADGRLIGDD
jgi:hypothetical protein